LRASQASRLVKGDTPRRCEPSSLDRGAGDLQQAGEVGPNGKIMQPPSARSFPLDDVRWFAAISGDPNPVHIDPEFAARTYPGAVVAHGVHLVLWALETQLPVDGAFPAGVKAVFLKPVIVGDEVEAETEQPDTIRLRVRGDAIAKIKLKATRAPERWAAGAPAHTPTHPPVIRRPPDSIADVRGALILPDAADALLAAFPNLGRRLGPRVLQGLAGMAPVSGGVMGGVTTELSVGFSDDAPSENLEYRLVSYRAALRRLQLAFWGYGLIGEVAALVGADVAGARAATGVETASTTDPLP
jgi:acyl dehydratase